MNFKESRLKEPELKLSRSSIYEVQIILVQQSSRGYIYLLPEIFVCFKCELKINIIVWIIYMESREYFEF